ncbi:MAG: hypothetical protein NC548_35565 [Lachnospiraceae bacterium]|nr:hypothetical protein [Lachnospiraceae bacterium]MCM1232711.1 hypothetical protein [Ruminococcus flavefaciens]
MCTNLGRGRSGNNKQSDQKSAFIPDAPVIEIKSYYRKGYYGDTVRIAKQTSEGNIVFENAKAEFDPGQKFDAKTKDVTFKVQHGFVWHNNDKRFYGINWDNVKSVSGNTYDMNNELKKRGFKWDSNSKSWRK